MRRWLALFAAACIAPAVIGWFLPIQHAQPRVNLTPYALKAQLGLGAGTLNKLANARLREILSTYGLVPKSVQIAQERIDGDTAYVGLRFTYGPAGGPAAGGSEATLIFHRSVWSFGQITSGISGPKS